MLWDVPSARLIGTLAAPSNGRGQRARLQEDASSGPALPKSFTPDGALIVADAPGRRLGVWDAMTGHEQVVMAWQGDTKFGRCSLTPDGTHVLIFISTWKHRGPPSWPPPERRMQLRSLSTGELCAEWSAHDDNDGKHCYSPDSATVVTWETIRKPELRVWDPLTGTHLGTLGIATAVVREIVFAPDGERLLCCLEVRPDDGSRGSGTFGDDAIELWDPRTSRRLGIAPGRFHGFSPDGRMLLVVHKGALSILSSADLDEVMRFVDDVPVRGAEWSRRGDTILVRQPTDPQWFWSSDTFGDHNSVVRLENWQVGPPIVTAWTRPDAEQPHTAGATASSTRILTVLRTAKQSLDAPKS
jgi:WD40 repeat protein